MSILLFLLIIVLIIVLPVVIFFSRLVQTVFRFKNNVNANQGSQSKTSAQQNESEKVFSKSEGEYVDFEEINGDIEDIE